MTNDLEYSEHISIIHRENAKLDSLSANNNMGELRESLVKIEDAARKANWRLNDLAYKK